MYNQMSPSLPVLTNYTLSSNRNQAQYNYTLSAIYDPLFAYWMHIYASINLHRHNIDTFTFKTEKCTKLFPHLTSTCIYYHSEFDRRRPMGNYISQICRYSSSSCPNHEQCPYAHNTYEHFYHFEQFKSKYCINQFNGYCKYGKECSFAHSQEELAVHSLDNYDLSNWFYINLFKTVWCPYTGKHNKASCVYAHNWQDFRRRPTLFYYTNKMCPYWDGNKFISSYELGCPNKANCSYCHGWKELQYHPMNFKKSMCTGVAHSLNHCFCYHAYFEMRSTDIDDLDNRPLLYNKLNISNINDQMAFLEESKLSMDSLYYIKYEEIEHSRDVYKLSKSKLSTDSLTTANQFLQHFPHDTCMSPLCKDTYSSQNLLTYHDKEYFIDE